PPRARGRGRGREFHGAQPWRGQPPRRLALRRQVLPRRGRQRLHWHSVRRVRTAAPGRHARAVRDRPVGRGGPVRAGHLLAPGAEGRGGSHRLKEANPGHLLLVSRTAVTRFTTSLKTPRTTAVAWKGTGPAGGARKNPPAACSATRVDLG